MASFNGFVLTNKGRELLAKAVAGEQLTFTKMEVGDGTFTGDIKTLTSLVSKKEDFNINQIENQGNGQVLLKAIINNQNTTIGYYIREIGVFAHGADNIEILYAYNKAIEADYFPAFNSSNVVEIEYQNIIIIDQAQNITAIIDPSLTYLTKDEASNTYVKNILIASETERGIISDLDIRSREAAYILGAAYGDVFGATLTSIEKGKTYYYWDSMKKTYIPYESLNTITKTDGFITPDAVNFKDISNTNMAYIIFKNTSDYKIYLDRQTNILHLLKKSVEIITLEEVVAQILNVVKNSDYTVNQGTVLANFNIVLNTSTAKAYNGYGIFLSISNGIAFFYGEDNTRVENNALFYFHSGEITIQMEVK